MKIAYVATVVILGATACTRQADVARHTVEDYRADRALRQDVFRKCVNDPGTLGKTPDCINASEAERMESFGSLRNSGSIGLEDKKKH